MTIQTQSFSQIVANAVTAVQGATTKLINFTSGSVLLAIMQATGGVTLWLQGIALQIVALTRFATSNGPDADSWGADFNFGRLPPKPSSGPVTFARFTPTVQATIQAATNGGLDANGNVIWTGGAPVQTADGSQQYMAIPDTTQSAYNASLNQYVIAAGTASCSATVVALKAGSAGNVAGGIINIMGGAIPHVDTVTNPGPFENGDDAELDPDYRARFVQYLASLSKCTPTAIKTAITSVQQDVTESLVENMTYGGVFQRGFFYAVVDDGSGAPPSGFLSTVANAIEANRPIGTEYGLFTPTVVNAAVVMAVTAAAGFTHSQVAALVQTAISNYINTLPMGAALLFTKLFEIAWEVQGVASVPLAGATLNGGTADLAVTPQQVLKTTSVVIN